MHIRKLIPAAILIGSLLAGAAQAKSCLPPGSPSNDPQDESNACAYNDYQKADQKLAAVYKSFRPIPDKLRESERAWIKYRDTECAFASDYVSGGKMESMVTSNCMEDLTNERIKQLEGDSANLSQ